MLQKPVETFWLYQVINITCTTLTKKNTVNENTVKPKIMDTIIIMQVDTESGSVTYLLSGPDVQEVSPVIIRKGLVLDYNQLP